MVGNSFNFSASCDTFTVNNSLSPSKQPTFVDVEPGLIANIRYAILLPREHPFSFHKFICQFICDRDSAIFCPANTTISINLLYLFHLSFTFSKFALILADFYFLPSETDFLWQTGQFYAWTLTFFHILQFKSLVEADRIFSKKGLTFLFFRAILLTIKQRRFGWISSKALFCV